MLEHLAVLLTDVVDSTVTNAALGDDTMDRVWAQHDRVSRALIRTHGGREIGRTDGFLAVFAHVDKAAQFALAYHEALERLEVSLRARVGIDVGDVDLRKNLPEDVETGATQQDIYGLAVPVAARLCAIARRRQTLLSSAAVTELTSADFKIASHGHWKIKGLDEPMEVFGLDDARSDLLPPEDGDKAYRVVLEQGAWFPAREIRHSLPADRGAFIGRAEDTRRLMCAIESGASLISITGTGGMGKTRIATHLARRCLGDFPGGAWFSDLSEARDADGIFAAVARGLDVATGAADPRNRIAQVIAGRGKCLVVLDNHEQVAALAGETVGHWLDRAPEAQFLVTTRERLGIPGECVVALDSMSRSDGAALFAQKALERQPDLRLGAEDVRAIDLLVELLDGLPLAIELAVGRLSMMSPASMLSRIGQRFTLLSARSGRLKRQATLRATFDWSWDLLTDAERTLLAQSSVFAGGFTLQAAESVLMPETSGPSVSVLDTLQSLVEKSLVRVAGERFGMLVSVREYGAERLALQRALASAVEQRHGSYFTQGEPDNPGKAVAELENIVVACRRAIARDDSDMAARGCAAAWRVLEPRGLFHVGVALAGSALEMTGLTPEARIRLTYIHGRCLLVSGDPKRARAQLEWTLAASKAAGLAVEELRALASLAELNAIEGRGDAAKLQYEEAVRRAAQIPGAAFLCATLNGLGVHFDRLGQFGAAKEQFQLALDAARSAGDRRWEGGSLSNLGQVEANLGNRAAAKRHYDDAIEVARQLGDRVWEGILLCNLGLFKLEEGDLDAAGEHLSRSLLLAREGGLSSLESVVLCNMGLLNEAANSAAASEQFYRDALRIARQRGDQRSQGQILGYLGLVVAKRTLPALGKELLDESITILRRINDRLSLAIALCRYAQGCVIWHDLQRGRACIDEAKAAAAEIGVAAESELALSLAHASRSIDDALRAA